MSSAMGTALFCMMVAVMAATLMIYLVVVDLKEDVSKLMDELRDDAWNEK